MRNKPKYTSANLLKVFSASGVEYEKARKLTGAAFDFLPSRERTKK